VGHQFDQQIFVDPTYDEELKSLGEGQMSTVRLFKDYEFEEDAIAAQLLQEDTTKLIDSGYIIFKLLKVDFGLQSDFSGNSLDAVEDKLQDEFKQDADIQL
jgi:hypothetical protein